MAGAAENPSAVGAPSTSGRAGCRAGCRTGTALLTLCRAGTPLLTLWGHAGLEVCYLGWLKGPALYRPVDSQPQIHPNVTRSEVVKKCVSRTPV